MGTAKSNAIRLQTTEVFVRGANAVDMAERIQELELKLSPPGRYVVEQSGTTMTVFGIDGAPAEGTFANGKISGVKIKPDGTSLLIQGISGIKELFLQLKPGPFPRDAVRVADAGAPIEMLNEYASLVANRDTLGAPELERLLALPREIGAAYQRRASVGEPRIRSVPEPVGESRQSSSSRAG